MATELDALAAQRPCHCGQPSLSNAVTNHIDAFGGSLHDGTSDSVAAVCSVSTASVERRGNSLNDTQIRLIAAIGASAVVTVGAVAVSINQDRSSLGTDAQSNMSTGVTVTESDAPTTLSVAEATPAMKGPAPLPSEEQGLPG
jgi:hypothetical protein